MERLYRPRNIAIIGASTDPNKLSGRPLQYLKNYRYQGKIAVVHPYQDMVQDFPAYRTVEDIPFEIDVALLLVPSQQIQDTLQSCGEQGIKFAIIIASGFAEAGNTSLQDNLKLISKKTGIRIIGPNCIGIINVNDGIPITFSTVLKNNIPKPGTIAIVSQSGAIANSIMQSCIKRNIGIHSVTSVGNEVDIDCLEVVDYLLDDPNVSMIPMFIEGLSDGNRLVELGQKAKNKNKMIYILHAGSSSGAQTASMSHTGRIAHSSNKIWKNICDQAGISIIPTIEELLLLAELENSFGKTRYEMPTDTNHGLAVLTVSGGLGVMIAEECYKKGLPLSKFELHTTQTLKELANLPSIQNPIDTALFADTNDYLKVARLLIKDNNVDCLMLIISSLAHDYQHLSNELLELGKEARKYNKKIIVSYLSLDDVLSDEIVTKLKNNHIVSVINPIKGVQVLSTFVQRDLITIKDQEENNSDTLDINKIGKDAEVVNHTEIKQTLEQYGVPLVSQCICQDVNEAINSAKEFDYPIVLKVVGPSHKSDIGGVRVGIKNDEELITNWEELKSIPQVEAIEVQKMVSGREVIIGGINDPEFGKILMIGSGGIWTEVLSDVAFTSPPVNQEKLDYIYKQLKSPVFKGGRNTKPINYRLLNEVITAFSQLWSNEEFEEFEINPLIVSDTNAVAVDWRATRSKSNEKVGNNY